MDSSFFPTRRGRRVLICVRGQCAESNRGKRLEKRLVELIQQHGLDDPSHPQHVSCTITNCLGICEDGPIMIVHPEAIKYGRVTEGALERIFQQHLLQGRPVDELIVQPPLSRPILKNAKHSRVKPYFRNKK
jgi:(2Fe-2S) ferredoxin